MIVYRLEDERGYGVWSSSLIRHKLSDHEGRYSRGRTVGSPWGARWVDYRYGCDSLESLMLYFGTGFGELLTQGFRVVKYKVRKNHTESSSIEVVFNYNKAECLGSIIPKSSYEQMREWRTERYRGKEFKQIFFDEYTTMDMTTTFTSPFGKEVT